MGLEIAKEKLGNALVKAKQFIIGDTKEKKLDIILDHLIDSIELRGDDVLITTKKNIAIQNDGHLVQINSGSHIMLSKEIHLNPRIKFNYNEFSKIQSNLDEARRLEEIELKEKIEKIEKENHDACNHTQK